MTRNLLLLPPLLLLTGCARNTYKVPQHQMPHTFEQQEKIKTEKITIAQWWYQFNDTTLNNLIDQAVKNNYSLEIAREKIEESRAFYRIAKAELMPQVDVVGNVNRTKFSQQSPNPVTTAQNEISFFQCGFDAAWELDFWGKIWHEKKARFYGIQAQVEQMRNVMITLIADVARAYIDLSTFNTLIDLTQKKITLERALTTLQADLFAAGLASEIEVTQQEQLLKATENSLKEQQTIFVQIKNRLAVLLGMNTEELPMPTLQTNVPLYNALIDAGIPLELLRRRPDIREAERRIAEAHELTQQAVAQWFPSFRLLGSVFTESAKGSKWFGDNSVSWSLGPSLRWPILNFGRIKARVDTQKSQERQAALAYSQTIITALAEVEDFLVSYFNNLEQLTIIEQKRNFAWQQQELTHAKYVSGLASELATLEAGINLINNETDFTRIKQATSTSVIALYKSLGGGW